MNKMKRILALIVVIWATTVSYSQIQHINATAINNRKMQLFGNKKWKSIAAEIKKYITLEGNAVKYVKVIEMPDKPKEQLFEITKNWADKNFNTPEYIVRSIDNEDCSVTVQGIINGVADHSGFLNTYEVSLKPMVTIQVKDGKARIIFIMSQYNVRIKEYGGPYGSDSYKNEIWNIGKCFPFISSMYDGHPAASAKALVMTHICATMYMEEIEQGLKNTEYIPKVNGENSDW